LCVGGWDDLTVGDDAHGEVLPNKESGHQKDKKVHRVIKHIEKKFQKEFVPGKNIVIDESAVEFKHKIIFETYNPKKQRSGVSDYLH
jgi:hypothetical protein